MNFWRFLAEQTRVLESEEPADRAKVIRQRPA